MKSNFKKGVASAFSIAILLLFIVLVSQSKYHTAHAQLGVPTEVVLDTSLTGVANASSLKGTTWKEYVGDKLAYVAAKTILHQLTVSVVNWINTGFKGKPSFLTNPEGFFLDAADQVTGDFLSRNGPLRNMCSPWSVDIRVALSLQQLQSTASGISGRPYTCTLGAIINRAANTRVTLNGDNITPFLKGDFNQGGWPAFIALTTEDQNNPYGTMLRARSDQLYAIGRRQSAISTDLQQGRGFLSFESCTDLPSDTPVGGEEDLDPNSTGEVNSTVKRGANGQPQSCKSSTPGSVIADALHDSLGTPTNELLLADNMNAIVSALISQLVTQALQKGLNSLSSSGGQGSGRAYLQSVYASTLRPTTINTAAVNNSSSDIQSLNLARQNYEQAVALIIDSAARYQSAERCFTDKYSTLPVTRLNEATAQITLINSALTTKTNPLIAALTNRRDSIGNMISQVQQSITIPGTTNSDELMQSIQTAINNSSSFLSGTNVAAVVTSSASDLLDAQTQSAIFNEDAASFQRFCSGM